MEEADVNNGRAAQKSGSNNMIPLSIQTPPSSTYSPLPHNNNKYNTKFHHLYVLPVLLLEFLALALTRAVLPSLLLQTFSSQIYLIMGITESIRGLLAFISCPLFGKISDVVGRKVCLFVTVLGTCAPVCALAVLPLDEDVNGGGYGDATAADDVSVLGGADDGGNSEFDEAVTTASAAAAAAGGGEEEWTTITSSLHAPSISYNRIYVFIILLSLSGIFSSTFTLTFAYISDTVKKKEERVAAYGLALATFGLSFTIGPMAGGYLSRVEDDVREEEEEIKSMMETTDEQQQHIIHPLGQRRVFTTSLVLTILDLLYICFILPESRFTNTTSEHDDVYEDDTSVLTTQSTTYNITKLRQSTLTITRSFRPFDALHVFTGDPLLAEVGRVAFLYYTSLWAVISTLALYAAQRFHFTPERLGELMSALGLSTMISEAILVRIIVPMLGTKQSIRIGLLAFVCQCVVLGLAYEPWHLFICAMLGMVANLVYPSLTGLVSGTVEVERVGEALGAVNGIKALTEGLGPLLFGTLMTWSERREGISLLPMGWPYLLAGLLALGAWKRSGFLPDEDADDDDNDEYVSEKYGWKARRRKRRGKNGEGGERRSMGETMQDVIVEFLKWQKDAEDASCDKDKSALSEMVRTEEEEDEFEGLLSEMDEDER